MGKAIVHSTYNICFRLFLHFTLFLHKQFAPITTQYPHFMHLRYIAVENIVRKGACNKQFLLFSQCFLLYMVLIFHFKCTLR